MGLDVEHLEHEWQHHGKAKVVFSCRSQGVGWLQQLGHVLHELDVAMLKGKSV